MNLNNGPTKQQLKEMIGACNDRAGSHIVWVTKEGEVCITRVKFGSPLDEFVKVRPEVRMYYEAFQVGNDYMGEEAAADDEWIDELYDNMRQEWAKAQDREGTVCAELVL